MWSDAASGLDREGTWGGQAGEVGVTVGDGGRRTTREFGDKSPKSLALVYKPILGDGLLVIVFPRCQIWVRVRLDVPGHKTPSATRSAKRRGDKKTYVLM